MEQLVYKTIAAAALLTAIGLLFKEGCFVHSSYEPAISLGRNLTPIQTQLRIYMSLLSSLGLTLILFNLFGGIMNDIPINISEQLGNMFLSAWSKQTIQLAYTLSAMVGCFFHNMEMPYNLDMKKTSHQNKSSKTPIADTCDFIHELITLSPLLVVGGWYCWKEISGFLETL